MRRHGFSLMFMDMLLFLLVKEKSEWVCHLFSVTISNMIYDVFSGRLHCLFIALYCCIVEF